MSVGDDGWVQLGDDGGIEYMPIWRDKEFAEACAIESWAGQEARPISLDTWIDK